MSIALRYSAVRTRNLILAGKEPYWVSEHPRADYVRQAYLSVLPWVDRTELRWIHRWKNMWSILTGVEHVIDNIVPLNHPRVCGLTVPWNLRLVPRSVNGFKGGHWCEGQEELFQCNSNL